jgi:phage repressor protein C with HTH and peptisase S24 domain
VKGKRLFCLVHIFEIEGLFMEWLLNIKRLKKEKNLTNETLAERSGISLGTINKLFSGASADPKFSTLCALSDAFGVSIDEMMGRKKSEDPELSKNEYFAKYMELGEEGRMLVNRVIAEEHARVLREQSTVTYTLDAPKTRTIRLYNISASAGTGSYLSSADYTNISLYATPVTDEADFAVKVYGDSMRPKYSSGDILLVKSANEVSVGEYGIFSVDGESYVKKFGGDRLISVNPEYSDIMLSEFNRIVCFGKVLGKLKK